MNNRRRKMSKRNKQLCVDRPEWEVLSAFEWRLKSVVATATLDAGRTGTLHRIASRDAKDNVTVAGRVRPASNQIWRNGS